MDDREARGLVLRRIDRLKNTGRFVTLGQLNDLGFDMIALDRYLGQLEDLNQITRNPKYSTRSGELNSDLI